MKKIITDMIWGSLAILACSIFMIIMFVGCSIVHSIYLSFVAMGFDSITTLPVVIALLSLASFLIFGAIYCILDVFENKEDEE